MFLLKGTTCHAGVDGGLCGTSDIAGVYCSGSAVENKNPFLGLG
jgi:hypothetical protein